MAQSPAVPVTDPDCPFCAIVAGAPAHIVWQQPHVVAFLDIRPLFPGHVLVVTREHVVTLEDLAAGEVGPYFTAVQRVAVAVREAMAAVGTFIGINNRVSQSVAHLHTHVVPRNPKDGLRGFFWPRGRYATDDEAEAVAARIRSALGG